MKPVRGVAQWLARLLWEQDVGGSTPPTPTIFLSVKIVSNPCKKQAMTLENIIFPSSLFLFALIIFLRLQKKWDCSLLPGLRSRCSRSQRALPLCRLPPPRPTILFSDFRSFMSGFFCALILPDELQAFTAKSLCNREQAENGEISVFQCVLHKSRPNSLLVNDSGHLCLW